MLGNILLLCLIGHISANLQYEIRTTWNGEKVRHEAVKINFSSDDGNYMIIDIEAPYFGAPSPPDGTCKEGFPYDELYNYEVVETFFLCDLSEEYVELEFAPCGAHLILLLHPRRTALVQYLPVNYTAEIDHTSGVWRGTAQVPVQYLPYQVNRFNAFAIHMGTTEEQENGLVWEDGKVYESLYPALDGIQPDFHNLDVFGDFDPAAINLQDVGSETWDSIRQNLQSQLYYEMETTVGGNRGDKPLQIWFERLDERNSLKISVRQEKVSSDLEMENSCDSLHDDRHDETAGVQVYFITEEEKYLQVILGFNSTNTASHQSDAASECTSASFLWGSNSLLERRFGSAEDFYYTEHLVSENDRQVWEASLSFSWNYLPPGIKYIQVINNNNDMSTQVDPADLILFREHSDNPVHDIEQSGLVYRALLVDVSYNDVVSPIWSEITLL